jgi:hypothetical protein
MKFYSTDIEMLMSEWDTLWKQVRKATDSVKRYFVKIPVEAFICFSEEYCESLRHQSIDSERSPYARTGTPKIHAKVGPLFDIGASEKGTSGLMKTASGLAVTTLNS